MASVFPGFVAADREPFWRSLSADDRAIGGARFDSLLLWGAPLVSLAAVAVLAAIAAAVPASDGKLMARAMVAVMAIITYSHLIAVVPRAYFNRDVLS